MRDRVRGPVAWMILCLAIGACGGGDETPTNGPDPAIQPFVGTWDAEVFTFISSPSAADTADMMLNGSFNINIQPSGGYTSTFVFGGIPSVEIGQLSVTGSTVILTPQTPAGPPATSSFSFPEPDYLVVEGQRTFDFNLDGTPDAADMRQELRRR